MERAIALVPSVKGAALASYPQIGTFFAQSATPSFAPDLAATLKDAGIPVHSIGPTRTQEVLYYERVTLPTGEEPADENAETPAAGDRAADEAQSGGLAAMRDETGNDAASTTSERVFNWGAEAMHAREAGAVAVERAPVTVAVVDSGVEDTHPDLEGRVDTQRSVKCSVNGVATQDLYGWRDEFYHGTHVAGIIAANHNDIGIDGIAPQATHRGDPGHERQSTHLSRVRDMRVHVGGRSRGGHRQQLLLDGPVGLLEPDGPGAGGGPGGGDPFD